MEPDYLLIRNLARTIVNKAPLPDFYVEQAEANQLSLDCYQHHKIILELKDQITPILTNNLGHGLHHAERVSIDAGALVNIVAKQRGISGLNRERLLLLVQCAGLLHDIKRREKEHAKASADFSEEFLNNFPFSREEISDISQAIRNHEAFKKHCGVFTDTGLILSNCLYDADKFRWGPDNFTHTVWDMVTHARIPLSVFMSHFPKGLQTVSRIRDTFRSTPGKQYGPQFIDIGMDIGRKLFDTIKREFPAILKNSI